MANITIQKLITVLLFIISFNLAASEFVPEVYEDDYIIVRSGIPQAGKKPVNLGDRLSLVIEAEFPTDEVIIENLDEQLFERNWGSEKGINLIRNPDIYTKDLEDGKTLIRGSFDFQMLDCPGDLTSCRGNKVYELPIFTLGYQIIDTGGNVVNNKSVRFNNVPSYVVVMQALDIRGEGGLEELSSYLGGSGYPSAMDVSEGEAASMWPVLTGGLIFMASFFPVLLTGNTQRRPETRRKTNTRWETVISQLTGTGDSLSDEEYSDMLRRGATWYCLDELSVNPYDWLGHHHGGDTNREFREFFIDVLNQESIAKDKRQDFINRFTSLSSTSAVQGS